MAEFLGIDISDSILNDPVSDELFNFIKSRAAKNTEIYRDLFACLLDDTITNYESAKKIKKN